MSATIVREVRPSGDGRHPANGATPDGPAGQGDGHSPPGGPGSNVRAIVPALFAIVLGTFMAILDTTVVNVALPTFARVFDADLRVLQWVITGYMLASAAVIPLAGWFSDRFGAKRVYITAVVLFTLGSLLCAAAPTAEALVLFRVLQGLGGGMLMPIGMSFLYRLAPPDKRGAVMGWFGVPMLLAPATGPALSGWLLEFSDWRFIFLINIPVGIVAAIVASRALPALPALRTAGRLDILGVVLGPLAFASLSYGIGESTGAGWTGATTLAGLAIGLAALAAFIARELTFEHPLLDLRVFRSRDFTLAIVTQWLMMAAVFGTFFMIPLFLQQVRGLGSFETGLATLPQPLTAALFMPIGGRLFDRFGARPLVVPGLLLTAGALWMYTSVSVTTTAAGLRLPLIMMGAGMGLMMMPLSTHLLNSTPRHLVGRVTSITGALQNVAASLAIATYATYLQAQVNTSIAALNTAGGAAAGVTASAIMPEGMPHAAGQVPAHLAPIFAAAFGDTYRLAMGVALAAAIVALSLRRRPLAARPGPTAGGPPTDPALSAPG